MALVKGTVKAMSNKFGKTSILVEDDSGNELGWFGSKFGFDCDRGDVVEFEDGGKKYVNSLRIVSSSGGSASGGKGVSTARSTGGTPGFPVPTNTKDRSIVRQNALSHATTLVSAIIAKHNYEIQEWEENETLLETWAQVVVSTARIFEDYTSGDGDARAIKEELENDS